MKRSFYLIGTIMVLLVACNGQPEQQAASSSDHPGVTTPSGQASPADDAMAKKAAIVQLDALEKLFNNENFLQVNGKDSSYFYFSRLGKSNMFVHTYKIVKGDSAGLKIDTIQIGASNKLQWNWQGKPLTLGNATDYVSRWTVNNNEKDKIEFQRIDNKTIHVVEGGKKLVLHRTLSLSLFLVRSYYDYQHGTKYAQDSVDNFKPRPVKPLNN